ncbi:MAG: hypothetical protein QM767_25895 [Anaeromyxobacter sp.]
MSKIDDESELMRFELRLPEGALRRRFGVFQRTQLVHASDVEDAQVVEEPGSKSRGKRVELRFLALPLCVENPSHRDATFRDAETFSK